MKNFKIRNLKSLLFFIIIFILSMNLIGCSKRPLSNSTTVLPPQKYEMPLEGVWVIDNYFVVEQSANSVELKNSIGKLISFDKKKILFFDDVCKNPKYKIKTVDTQNYFIGNYSIKPESVGVNQSTVQVVTATTNENFLASFIILNENTILTYKNGAFLHLSKNNQLSSSATNIDAVINSGENNTTSKSEAPKSYNSNSSNSAIFDEYNSGFLIGLKSYKSVSDDTGAYSFYDIEPLEPVYRTIWINFSGDSIISTKELPFILAPRLNGFWIINNKRTIGDSFIKDNLYSYPIEKDFNESLISNDKNNLYNSSSLIDISFIGSDYISLESKNITYDKTKDHFNKSNDLQVLPLDMINSSSSSNSSPIPIDKLLGEQGIKALKQGAATYINSLDYDSRQKLEQFPNLNNFGLNRKNGKWNLIGRLNYSSEGYNDVFGDFDIPIMPSKELVRYDSLYPTWNIIKERVPDVVDAYSPPNKNFVLVLTKSDILVYDIINEHLSDKPLKKIPLNKDETVIMSHWATGKYVEVWNESVASIPPSKER